MKEGEREKGEKFLLFIFIFFRDSGSLFISLSVLRACYVDRLALISDRTVFL